MYIFLYLYSYTRKPVFAHLMFSVNLVHAKAGEYENYKDYEINVFHHIRLCETSLYVYLLR